MRKINIFQQQINKIYNGFVGFRICWMCFMSHSTSQKRQEKMTQQRIFQGSVVFDCFDNCDL